MRTLILLVLTACAPGGSSVVGTKTGGPNLPGSLPPGVTVEPGPIVRPHYIVTLDLDRAGTVWMGCARDDVPEEVLVFEATEVADQHRFDVLGLAAETSYTCTAHVDGGASVSFPIVVPEVTETPKFTVERDPSLEMSGAYTMVNSSDGCFMGTNAQVIVTDPDGRHRWVYDLGLGYDIDIDTALTVDGNIHMGGGWALTDEDADHRGVLRTVAPDGTLLVDRNEPAFGLGYNHHSEPMPDGTYLSSTMSWMDDGAHQWYGVGVERYDPTIGAPSWTWDTTTMLDAGQLAWVPGTVTPYHANSVTWIDDAQGPALLVSLYSAKEIWRIDRNTGLRTWRLGQGGSFDLIDPAGNALPESEWFYVQHDPDWTEDGRVLLYDNGQGRPGTDFSRVAELQLDTDAMTATLLWTWDDGGFYNPVVGDADWLPNGNVLVTKGFVLCWTPDSLDVSQVVEVDRQTGDVIWRQSWPSRSLATFRAERYDGCDLFANNARYCPAAATRLAELEAGL